MKKRLVAFLLTLCLCVGLAGPVSAATAETVVLQMNSNRMAVDSQVVQVDDQNPAVVPFAENGRTLVPVSRIVDAFGGKSTWDPKTNATTFTLNGKTVSHVIGTNVVTTPRKVTFMSVSSRALNNRTYVPVRYVLEGLGLYVGYEATRQLVVVSTQPLDENGLLELSGAKTLLGGRPDPAQTTVPASNYTAGTLIAPARTRGGMEPVYEDAVYVQDLGSATGFIFRLEENAYGNNHFRYEGEEDYSGEERFAQLREYVDLLAAQPDFKLVRALGPDEEFDDTWFACLDYTGSKARMRGSEACWLWDERVVHVEIMAPEDANYVVVNLDENLKYQDLSLRTQKGAELLSPNQISGQRVGDAYYLDNGAYYNAGDKKLSTLSGCAALLVDGRPCTGQVTFGPGKNNADQLQITGYNRTEQLTVTIPQNYALNGDVYGRELMRSGPGKRTPEHPRMEMGYTNNVLFSTLRARRDEATVRVIRWDKSGGDTVLYFHLKGEYDGIVHEYEGLAAARWTDPDAAAVSTGSGGGEKDCWYCTGSGDCPTCHGSGRVRNWMPGTAHTFLDQDCSDCYSPGKCRMCGGSGKVRN